MMDFKNKSAICRWNDQIYSRLIYPSFVKYLDPQIFT